MAVGVPGHEVFAAADRLMARGERPTVERVRLELGRGSPARIGALLDQWWEQLAGRLGDEGRLSNLPADVTQAFVAVWQEATSVAKSVSNEELASQREGFSQQGEALVDHERRMRMDGAQQTRASTVVQDSAEVRLTGLEQLLLQREGQIGDLHERCELLSAQRDEAIQALNLARKEEQKFQQQADQARQDMRPYTWDAEDRARREIDCLREENKGFASQIKDANGKLQRLQERLGSVQADLSDAREQQSVAQLQLFEAHTRAEALYQQLIEVREELSKARLDIAKQP